MKFYRLLNNHLDHSRQDVAEATELLKRIKADLNPHAFTVREIVDEGYDGRLSIPGRFSKPMTDTARMRRVRRLLKFLQNEGWVEKPDPVEHVFSLTEVTCMQRFED
jgi:hypothetical protein